MFKKKQKKGEGKQQQQPDAPIEGSSQFNNAAKQVIQEMQPMMMNQQLPPQAQPPSGGLMGNVMTKMVGSGQVDDRGLLDNDPHYDPMDDGQTPNRRQARQQRMRGNQDLWLLNLFFKGCAFLSYFFLPIVFPKALSYIVVLMLTSIDFWIVKNIVGRKLIKMRWWFIIDDQGNERWWYESKECNILFQDKLVFWGSLYVYPLVWVVFCVMNGITIQIFETSTTFVCALIGAVQLWGFRNCKNAHERKKTLQRRRRQGGPRRGPPPNRGGNPMQENLLPYPPPNQMPPQNPNYRQ